MTSSIYKVIILGSPGVGKSSIINRFIEGTFSPQAKPTMGASFYTHVCSVGDSAITLQIWDTAGQDRFRSISKAYFRNAMGGVLVLDVTNPLSFDDLASWLTDFQSLATPNACVILVANKIDLQDLRQVGSRELREFSEKNDMELIETSACSGHNIEALFNRMAIEIHARVERRAIVLTDSLNPGGIAQPPPGKAGCCSN
jgi:small GTP-binding protein